MNSIYIIRGKNTIIHLEKLYLTFYPSYLLKINFFDILRWGLSSKT